MTRSPQQEAFIQELLSGTSGIALSARAGSGKTTTLVDGANQDSIPTLAVAFNKNIAEALAKKMPSTVVCKTMNSLGHSAWGKHLGKRLNLNTEKIFQIANKHVPADIKKPLMGEFMRLVNLFRNTTAVPEGALGGVKSEGEPWADLIDEHDLDFKRLRPEVIADISRKILLESIEEAWKGNIDFSDQVYMPVIYRSRFESFPRILADEAQDLSPLQHLMLRRALDSSGRMIAVGDPYQAIYAWRGASSSSMSDMMSMFSCKEMPLTVSYRCPKLVIAEANRFVSDISAAEGAADGEVLAEVPWHKREILPGDWIICRNNQPLVKMFFNLAKKGIACKIRGRSIGITLIKLVDRITSDTPLLIPDFLRLASDFRNTWVSSYMEQGKEAKANDIADRVMALCVIGENLHTNATTEDLKTRLHSMFSDDASAPVMLSTIHKSKGLEAPRVHFLDRSLIPSTWARSPDAKQQEYNLAYVAITRAMNTLSYIRSADEG